MRVLGSEGVVEKEEEEKVVVAIWYECLICS